MKIICWNMAAAFGYNAARHAEAWAWLQNQEPDVALLQEVVIPDTGSLDWDSVVHRPKYGKHWGSAVLTRGSRYTTFEPGSGQPWLREIGGAACVAQPEDADDPWLVSIHSSATAYTPEELVSLPSLDGVARCAEGPLWEIEVAVHELQAILHGHRFIVGGDLNSALLMDEVYRTDDNQRLFANIAAAGMVDLRHRHAPTEQQTFFQPRRRPYQLDHIYADAATEQLVTNWRVIPDLAVDPRLSDHAPILVTLGDGRAG